MDDADELSEPVVEALAALAALQAPGRVREHGSAREWLAAQLAAAEAIDRPVQVAVLRERAIAAGWTWPQVRRARDALDVKTVRRPVECWRFPLPRER